MIQTNYFFRNPDFQFKDIGKMTGQIIFTENKIENNPAKRQSVCLCCLYQIIQKTQSNRTHN